MIGLAPSSPGVAAMLLFYHGTVTVLIGPGNIKSLRRVILPEALSVHAPVGPVGRAKAVMWRDA